jgi:hypothetical protein
VTRRWILTAALCAAVGVGVPAVAALMSPRAAPPAQLSLNTELPVFAIAGMVPGDFMTRCLRVRNEGSDPIGLVDGMYVTGELKAYLWAVVEKGTGLGDAGPSCAGFTPSGGYAYGTNAAGIPVASLVPDYAADWPAQGEKSLRATVWMPSTTPVAAAAKTGALTFAFAGYPKSDGDAGTPDLPGGIAPGTTGGFDADGNFLPNAEIKKRLRIGKARLLKNGNVVVKMFLPAGGAIRAKVILPNGVYYAHTLLPEEWGPTVRVVLKRRDVGRQAAAKARRTGKRLRTTVTTRYRWAHGPDAFVQPEQKLTIVKKRG